MNKISSLTLSYQEGRFVFALLAGTMLHGQESRSRNKIADMLKAKILEFEKERMDLINKWGKKGKDGKTEEKDGKFVMTDQKKFEEEFKELTLTSSNFVFDILPSNKRYFADVKEIILNTKQEMNYADGEVYEKVCEKLEKI